MTDEQPPSSQRHPFPAGSLRRAALIGVLLAEVFALTWMRSAGARWEELLIPIAICLGTALFIGGQLFFRENPEISEGRERVREAQRDVEGALRGSQDIFANTGTMRVRLVPTPAAGDAGEPQREEDAAALEERRDLALSRLWRLTQARLDLYHTIATTQARRSFVSAQFSMVAGFVMLTAFVVLALNVSSTSGAIVAGGLGAVSAALAGFISKTFVRSQQTAAEHLKAYFDQPLEFSRYLAAERLLADANLPDEQRAEVVAALVQTIAAGPAAPAPVDTRALLEQLLPGVPGQR